MSELHFDVFLAHNSLDKPLVRIISAELKQFNISSWLDEEEILAGQYFQDSIQQAISKVGAAAVCIGRTGLGRWQQTELRVLVSQCVTRGIPVIPILLPGVKDIPEENIFLKEFHTISFEQSITESKSLVLLARGITRQKKRNQFESQLLTLDCVFSSEASSDLRYQQALLYKLKESRELSSSQLSEYIEGLKEYIDLMQRQKENTDCELENIESRITSIERILLEEKGSNLLDAIDWLESNQKHIAEAVTSKVIAKIDVPIQGLICKETNPMFDWIVERFVETVIHYLTAEGRGVDTLIESMSISPHYIPYAIESITYIRNRLHRQDFAEDIKEQINLALNEIVYCLKSEINS